MTIVTLDSGEKIFYTGNKPYSILKLTVSQRKGISSVEIKTASQEEIFRIYAFLKKNSYSARVSDRVSTCYQNSRVWFNPEDGIRIGEKGVFFESDIEATLTVRLLTKDLDSFDTFFQGFMKENGYKSYHKVGKHIVLA